MVEEKGLPGHVADRIGEFVVLRGQPQELLAKLSEASECGVGRSAGVPVHRHAGPASSTAGGHEGCALQAQWAPTTSPYPPIPNSTRRPLAQHAESATAMHIRLLSVSNRLAHATRRPPAGAARRVGGGA